MTTDPIQAAIEALEKSYPYYEGSTPSPEYEEHHKATLALRQHQQDGGWRPIDSAPKDGTWFVIHRQGEDDYEVGRYNPLMVDRYEPVEGDLYRRVQESAYEWDGFNNFHRATHWQPLPPAPKKENDDERS